MTAPVGFRGDFTGPQLRMAAKQTKDAAFSRRLLALAEIYDAGSRSDAAHNGGVGLQTIRDWVRRSNTWGPDGLKDCKASGQPSRLKDEHRRALIQMVGKGQTPPCTG
jgi:transposase